MDSKSVSKKIIPWVAAVVVVAGLMGGSYALGYRIGVENPATIIVEGIANIEDEDIKADFAIFWEAWKKLKAQHLEGEKITDKEFVFGAISGLAGAFKDPNTSFLRADTGDAKRFEEDISGTFGGIGAEIGLKDKQLVIISPLKKSPAELAGVKGGDRILKIDDFLTENITLNDAVKRIRGPIGTAVVLNIAREDWLAPRDIKIVRDEIVIPTLDWEPIGDDIAHIKLFSFNEKAPVLFYDVGIDVVLKQAKGIVLDLRNNPGGFLEVAINIAGWFLERGQVVVKERFKDPSSDRIFRANGNEAFKNTPMVILVDQGSASASEILAGALRDHRAVKLVGAKTFGKGTVQELHPLHDGSKLKITVAKWVLPDGKVIEEGGLKPDFEVKLTEEDVKAEKDPQLDKAIKLLRAQIP